MKLSLSVRPRMNASGATSTVPRSMYALSFSGSHHVVEGVEQRPHVPVDLRERVAGEEAEPLAGLDRRTREDDSADLALRERVHGERIARQVLPVPAGRCRR